MSHASKVMLKILQARLQQYLNWELPDVQAGFGQSRGTRDQIANIQWIIEKTRGFQKNLCCIDYAKAFDCVGHKKNCGKFLKRWEYQTCLLRNWYTGQEATVRTLHGTMNWFKIGKGVQQGCILSFCLSNFYASSLSLSSCKTPGWINHNLESRWQGEISTVSDMQMILL